MWQHSGMFAHFIYIYSQTTALTLLVATTHQSTVRTYNIIQYLNKNNVELNQKLF